ncbi:MULTISPECIES: large conductance mechanosensitive channel protein MscL [Microbacterium]|uniref:Large-conductance mechanosensitive channel n=1 Tax=Microbacterium resistens TaxID=156977 RepID=A0ABY3RRS9_9MICO|nr:large conductance mechanosensitive channel protein MscL [Microbacterium resistens]MBW1638175.1 large conductance mechanosensitive channel protein MscL [Microbacterium resistens]MDA4894579.1 large conductance mechanosensitive channel protein MscL [Streptomyces sp. MS2A]UGS26669.1 large conductance mechanosensitive channel protein MscL [Microbacterium resistens]
MIQGFKDFILRGNVIDLAVAVVIGAAFSKIIDVIVAALINPLIAMFFNADSLDTALQLQVPTLLGGTSTFAFGAILGAVINFLAVALIVYLVFVMPMNKFKERQAAKAGVSEEEAELTEQQLLVQIRDLLEKQQIK